MRFELTPEHEKFRDELRKWLEEHVDRDWPRRYGHDDGAMARYQQEWDRKLYAAGYAGLSWPREYGGRAADVVQQAIFAAECARAHAPEGLARTGIRLVGPALMRYGTKEQQRHLQPILRGEEIWCQGFSEPEAGSDLAGLKTRAVRRGDRWVINGRKIWTSHGQFADWMILLARTGSPESRAAGISVFLLDMRTPGIEISPIRTLKGSMHFNEITFSDVEIGPESLLGEQDKGWEIVTSVLRDERGPGSLLVRSSDIQRIFGNIASHARQVGSGPAHDQALGALYGRAFASSLVTIELLRQEHAGTAPPGLASMSRLFVTTTWRTLVDDALLHWGGGLFDRYGATHIDDHLESWRYTLGGGTSEIQRNIVAAALLQLPSSRRGRG